MIFLSSERRRILQLVMIMAAVAMAIGGTSLYVLYDTAFEEAAARLTDTAQSRARFMEAIARFDQLHNKDFPGGPVNATVSQIQDAHDNFKGFGETGEFVLARQDGDMIAFILRHRHHDLDQPESVPFHQDMNGEMHLAEPMRRALLGQSGVVIAPDYRGETVLAAHEPVAVLGFGVVAKMDLSEIRRPFIGAGLYLAGFSAVIVGIGTLIFFRVSEPMVQRITEMAALKRSRERLVQAEEEIRKQAVYLDNILSSALDLAIVATDDRFIVRYFNTTAEKLFGYEKKEIIGRNVTEIHEWEGVEPSAFEEGVERIKVIGFHEYRINKERGGNEVIIESRVSGIHDENGQRVGYVLMAKDITARQMAENALVKSERKYRLLMEYANDAIFVADAETGTILDANKAAAELIGCSVFELIGMHQADLHPPEKLESYQALFAEHVKSGFGVVSDIVVQHRDGRRIPVEIRAGVTDLGEKRVIQGIFRDVTERKKAEDAIRESRAGLAKAQEIAHLGSWDWNIISDTLTWSDEVFRIFAVDTAEFFTTYDSFLKSVHPEDRKQVVEAVDAALKYPDKPYDIQHRIVRPDGTQRVVREQAEIIRDDQGQAVRMLGTVHDITELKEIEQALIELNNNLESRVAQRTSQLAAANLELEAYSYSVAHDLKAPLNNAIGFCRILSDEFQEQFDHDGREHLEWLFKSILQMRSRVDDYLQLARSTRVSFHVQEVDLSELMAQAVATVAQDSPELAGVEVDITPNLLVNGDSNLLSVVAENLIANAFKFSGSQEKAKIEFGVEKNSAGEDEFFVRDNGVGFDQEYSSRLFEPFERLHDQDEFSGSGIGLTTVKRIIERHNGKIRGQATPGDGATFYFTIGTLVQDPNQGEGAG